MRALAIRNPAGSFRLRILLACAGGLLAAVGSGCRHGDATSAGPAPAPANSASTATQVIVAHPQCGAISDVASVTGALAAQEDVTVGTKAPGKIIAVYVREGDTVKAGQIVAQQDTTDLQNQLDQARANLSSAISRVESAKVTYRNALQTLRWTDGQTRTAVGQAQAALDVAREQAAVVKEGSRPQEIQQAQENVAAAKADRDNARADLKRYQDLYRQQAISQQQLDQAQSVADSADARYNSAVQALSLAQEGSRPQDIRRAQAAVEQANQALAAARSNQEQVGMRRTDAENARVGIDTANALVDQAKAAVRLAQQAIADSSIRSRIDGAVAERKVEPGTQAGPAQPVARIVGLNTIYFDAQISEAQYSEIRVGQPVKVYVDALPKLTFRGAVSRIFPVASSVARSFTARISLANKGTMLRPQMFARGEIKFAGHANALLVPRSAVLSRSVDAGRVFIVVDGKAVSRNVQLGFSNINEIEVTHGLQMRDEVVTQGQAMLQNGDRVQVIGRPEPAQAADRKS
jgi:RND family efflux transporter MFP subunit